MSLLQQRRLMAVNWIPGALLLSQRCRTVNPAFTMKSPIPFIFEWQLTRRTALPGRFCALRSVSTSFGLSVLMFVLHLGDLEALASPATSGLKERIYQESHETFPNPERGFYSPVTTGRTRNLDGLRRQGISLLLVTTDLREFKERDLSTEKVAEIREPFTAARRAGLTVIFRAAYGFTNRDYRADPKDMDR